MYYREAEGNIEHLQHRWTAFSAQSRTALLTQVLWYLPSLPCDPTLASPNDVNDETLGGATFHLQAPELNLIDILPTSTIAHGISSHNHLRLRIATTAIEIANRFAPSRKPNLQLQDALPHHRGQVHWDDQSRSSDCTSSRRTLFSDILAQNTDRISNRRASPTLFPPNRSRSCSPCPAPRPQPTPSRKPRASRLCTSQL
jgi:hypothetical protein